MDLEPLRRVDHQDLLTLARKVAAAAHDGDRERLEANSLRLFEAFVVHVGAERPVLLDLEPGEARILLRGQERVMDTLLELAISTELGGDCQCQSFADDLLARLTLQAHDERHHLAH